MRDELSKDGGAGEVDPFALARRDLKKALPRRFWREVTVARRETSFGIDLDGKPARTPGRALLEVATADLAERLAAEWAAQAEYVEPATMPLTRIVNTATDGVAHATPATIDEVVKFAETDLVCYRASTPRSLVEEQAKVWDPILTFAHEALGARFICAEGVMYAEQPAGARQAVRQAVETIARQPSGVLKLTAVSLMTNLMGSVLLALAVAYEALDADSAWAAAHVDEDYQMRSWGEDEEAKLRRAERRRDMLAAAEAYRLAA